MRKIILLLILVLIPSVAAMTHFFEFQVINARNPETLYPQANCTMNISYVNGGMVLTDVKLQNKSDGFHNYSYDFEKGIYFGNVFCQFNNSYGRVAFPLYINVSSVDTSTICESNPNSQLCKYLEEINITTNETYDKLDNLTVGATSTASGGGGGTGYTPCPVGMKIQKDDSGGTWCVKKSLWERFLENNVLLVGILIIITLTLVITYEDWIKKKFKNAN